MPKTVSFKTGDWIKYRYDASGAKLSSENYSASKGLTTTRYYVGNKVYDSHVLKTILTEGGYVEKSGNAYSYFFYLKDHQGNNRMVVNSAKSVVQAQNYYAFGLPMWEGTMYPSAQPYKFNGKELDRLSGVDLYDYGARVYDAAFARFTTMDPLAEKYYSISPYAYCLNNPMKYVDPTGMLVEEDEEKVSFTGEDAQKMFAQLRNSLSSVSNHVAGFFGLNNDPKDMEARVQTKERLAQAQQNIDVANEFMTALVPGGNFVKFGYDLYNGNANAVWAAVPFLALDAATAGNGKVAGSGIKFLKVEQFAKRLGTTVEEYHKTVKAVMKKDFAKEMKALGTTNPDFSPNEIGNIVLRNPQTGKTLITNIPLDIYKQ